MRGLTGSFLVQTYDQVCFCCLLWVVCILFCGVVVRCVAHCCAVVCQSPKRFLWRSLATHQYSPFLFSLLGCQSCVFIVEFCFPFIICCVVMCLHCVVQKSAPRRCTRPSSTTTTDHSLCSTLCRFVLLLPFCFTFNLSFPRFHFCIVFRCVVVCCNVLCRSQLSLFSTSPSPTSPSQVHHSPSALFLRLSSRVCVSVCCVSVSHF